MTTYSKSIDMSAHDDASFRVYMSSIIEAFTNLGWVQCSEQPQFNVTTGQFGAGGQLMFKANDALASEVPIFVKLVTFIDFTASPGVYTELSVGTGIDSGGNLTGRWQAPVVSSHSVGALSNTELRICGDAGSVYFMHWDIVTHSKMNFFCVDRLNDPQGVASDEGVIFMSHQGTNSQNISIYYKQTGAVHNVSGAAVLGCFWNNFGNPLHMGASGNATSLNQPTIYSGGGYSFPLYLIRNSDVSEFNTFTGTLDGVSHTLLRVGSAMQGFDSTTGFAMPWE